MGLKNGVRSSDWKWDENQLCFCLGGEEMTKIKPGLKQALFKGLCHFVCSHVNLHISQIVCYMTQNT